MFPPTVERWRGIVEELAPAIPAALVLAVIRRESGGRQGARGATRDYGLMQVKPATLAEYNKRHEQKIAAEQLLGEDLEAAKDQIRVGVWYLQHCLRRVHSWRPDLAPWPDGPLTDYQIQLGDLCYSRGPGGAGALRRRALGAGYPDSYQGIYTYRETHEPDWGKPGHPFNHAAAVLAMTRTDGTGSGRPPALLPERSPSRPRPREGGGALALLIAAGMLIAAAR